MLEVKYSSHILKQYSYTKIIVHVVLGPLPTYVLHGQFDKRRRCFFWSMDDTCKSAQCLVPWDKICTPKGNGGSRGQKH